MEVKAAVQRVAVLDVDGVPGLYGAVIGHASIAYAPLDGSARRLESRAIVELDEQDRGYLEGRRAYISAIVVHPESVRPIEDGARVDVRPPADPLAAAGEAKRAETPIGSKWCERSRTDSPAIEVFGASDMFVAFQEIGGRFASVRTHPEFHQLYKRTA